MKPKTRVITGGSWWRYSRYEIRDGCIGPARGAVLEDFNPWDYFGPSARPGAAPYEELVDLARDWPGSSRGATRRRPSLDASRVKRITDWCQNFGLLGALLHWTDFVRLTPDAQGRQNILVHGASGWSRSFFARQAPGDISLAEVALRPDSGGPPVFEAPGRTWSNFFPGIGEAASVSPALPTPLSADFWAIYAEPVDEFMAAAQQLHLALEATSNEVGNAPYEFEPLLLRVHPHPELRKSELFVGWRSTSLLSTLAMMAMLDLAKGGKYLRCRRCDRPFVSAAYQAVYCSARCRNSANVTAFRSRAKAARKPPPKKRTGRRSAP